MTDPKPRSADDPPVETWDDYRKRGIGLERVHRAEPAPGFRGTNAQRHPWFADAPGHQTIGRTFPPLEDDELDR